MSLPFLVPPIIDVKDGAVLFDGGLFSNQPVEVARDRGAKSIFVNIIAAPDDLPAKDFMDIQHNGFRSAISWLLFW